MSSNLTAALEPSRGARADSSCAPRCGAATGLTGLIFDVDDVLYDATLWRRWFWQLLGKLGVRASYGDFYRDWDRDYLADVHCGRREFGEALHSFLLATGLSWAQIDEVEAASRIQRHNFEVNVRPLPGVVKTIGEIAALGLPLLALADAACTAGELAERLESLGVGGCFRRVLSSFDLETTPLDPDFYQAALGVLDMPPETVAYIGHDAQHLQGAKAAGLRTVAFNFPDHAEADFRLTRFEDLLPLIKKWPADSPPQAERGAAFGHSHP